MALTMHEKQAVTKHLGLKCRPARKKEKGKILDTAIDLAGYNRSYAARVLRAIEAVTVARSMGFKVLIDFNCRARPWLQDRPREVMTRLMEDDNSLITIEEGIQEIFGVGERTYEEMEWILDAGNLRIAR